MTKAERTAFLKQMREEASSESQALLAELLEDLAEEIEKMKKNPDTEAAPKPKRKYE